MRFVKMHGAGNDYVYVDCFDQPPPADPAALAVAVSDRHTGIGADGLILIAPTERADARMTMFNADGSRAEMCGNGIRCVARYLYDHGHVEHAAPQIETDAGVLELQLRLDGDRVTAVRVDMGPPVLAAARIPTTLEGDPPIERPLTVDGRTWHVTGVSMGNPHAVLFVDELDDETVSVVGPAVERHPVFPQRTNVEFVRVVSPGEIAMRVWERGSGETLACGTGACAAVVAGALTGRTRRDVVCRLPGGELHIEWSTAGAVFLTGPAVEVFEGEWPEPRAA